MASAGSSNTQTISLKLLVHTKTRRVLFAEASKEFVDFLFHILSLPMGTMIGLLKKNGSTVGSLGTLYSSIEGLTDNYLVPTMTKDTILNVPKIGNTVVPLLLFPDGGGDDQVPVTRKLYSCWNCHRYVTDNTSTVCPQCRYTISTEVTYVNDRKVSKAAAMAAGDGGFVKGVVTYMVMDDLSVTPMSTISSITLLNKFNIKEVGDLDEKVVTFGMSEGLKLLKASLQTKNVLTSVFLGSLK